ncbi:hypothetical protein Cthiooxydans_42060 [Comamonas thiooxydans]|uniref:hypothetical protein n=1 Tax=Comamonas thiooxydans TaxID=363952 RepID=UPI001E49FA28|nr:hypothetical protein [Comamonas thiooxydans]BDB71794.1 hypothetical protein Cthiooxydans_42060 [Comamonas thiooxydans]
MTDSSIPGSFDDDFSEDIELDLSFSEDKEYQAAYLKGLYSRGKTFRKYEEVLDEYEGLCMEIASTGDYPSSREQYRWLSFELNALGKLAPAFRRKLETGRAKNDPVFLLIHRDQVVIDCHWLYCTRSGVHVNSNDRKFANLFDLNLPFDFELADHFAAMKLKTENRVLEIMRLTGYQQVQLVALRSDAMKEKAKSLEAPRTDGKKRLPSIRSVFESQMFTWGTKVTRVQQHYPTYRVLWLLHTLLGTGVNGRMLSELTALALGTSPKDPKTVKDQLDTLLARTQGGCLE